MNVLVVATDGFHFVHVSKDTKTQKSFDNEAQVIANNFGQIDILCLDMDCRKSEQCHNPEWLKTEKERLSGLFKFRKFVVNDECSFSSYTFSTNTLVDALISKKNWRNVPGEQWTEL